MFNLIEWLYLRQKNNLVYYDSRTGCKSRMYYDRVIKKKYLSKELDVVFVDIDCLKQINDKEGHHKGSELLKHVVGKLEALNGVSDVCRYGGDEFLVFGHNIKEEELNAIREVSWGKYTKEEYECFSSAVQKADKFMYAQKQSKKVARQLIS